MNWFTVRHFVVFQLLLLCYCPYSFSQRTASGPETTSAEEERAVRFVIRRGGDPIQPGIKRELGLVMVDDKDQDNEPQSHAGLPEFPVVMLLKYTNREGQNAETEFYSRYRC